jgi:hypothetical protein
MGPNARPESIAQFGRDVGSILPMIGLIPGLREPVAQLLGGRRGLATFAGLSIAEAGRFQIGPGGQLGLGATELGDITRTLHNELFAPGRNLDRMGGLRSDQGAEALLEMTRRGMGPSGGVRSGNMGTIKADLERFAPAIRAMQEIFGENGDPNAPMPKIFDALEKMTGGGLRHMDPAKTTQMLRDMQNLAKFTGQSMEGVFANIQATAQMGVQMGLDPALARAIAPQASIDAMTHMASVRGSGSQMGMFFGGLDAAGHLAERHIMTMRAGGSDLARRGALAIFAGESARGGLRGDAARLVAAIRGGDATFAGGRSVHAVLENQETLRKMLVAGGASDSDINAALSSPKFLDQYIAKHNLAAFALEGFSREVDTRLGSAYEGVAYDALKRGGMGQAEAAKQAADVGVAAMDAMRNLTDAEKRAGPAEGQKKIAAKLRARFPQLTEEQAHDIATQGWIRADATALGLYNKNALNIMQTSTPVSPAVRVRIAAISQMQTALAGAGGNTSALQRISDVLQRKAANPNLSIHDAVASLMGGVPSKVVSDKMEKLMQQFTKNTDEIAALENNPEVNQQRISQIREETARIMGDMAGLQTEHAKNSLKEMGTAGMGALRATGLTGVASLPGVSAAAGFLSKIDVGALAAAGERNGMQKSWLEGILKIEGLPDLILKLVKGRLGTSRAAT